MAQWIDKKLLDDFEDQQKEAVKKLELKTATVRNSGVKPQGQWIRKIVDKIRISEIANQKNALTCPNCEYPLQFDDSRGWFICTQAKYSKMQQCDFAGNIVDFTDFLMRCGKW